MVVTFEMQYLENLYTKGKAQEKIPLSTSDYQRLPKSDKVLDFSQANRRFVPDKVIAF